MIKIKNKLTQTIKLLSSAVIVAGSVSAMATDHREAPGIYEDPAADITDLFAYVSPYDLTKLVIAMNVNALASPANPQSYQFSSGVRYNFNIDTNGDAIVDRKIKVRFSKPDFKNQEIKIEFPHDIELRGESTYTPTQSIDTPTPVINEGPQGIKFFAGLRDDPFFFDGVAAFRFFTGLGTFSTAIDRLAGLNVSAIVVELPLSLVSDYPGQKLQIWADTQRKIDGKWRQIQRVGNPGVKPVFIPPSLKDQFNRTLPHDDARLYSGVIRDTVIHSKLAQTEEVAKLVLSQIVPDTLKLDPSKPSFWPNGRGLEEDIFDVVFSWNLYKPTVFAPGDLDGVHNNDVEFLHEFPYLAPPHIAP